MKYIYTASCWNTFVKIAFHVLNPYGSYWSRKKSQTKGNKECCAPRKNKDGWFKIKNGTCDGLWMKIACPYHYMSSRVHIFSPCIQGGTNFKWNHLQTRVGLPRSFCLAEKKMLFFTKTTLICHYHNNALLRYNGSWPMTMSRKSRPGTRSFDTSSRNSPSREKEADRTTDEE